MISIRNLRAIDDLASRKPLMRVNSQSTINKLISPYLAAQVDTIEDLVAVINNDPNHEALVNEMGRQLAGIMRDKVSFIRNEVGVLIEEMTTNVERRLSSLKPYPLPVSVVTQSLPTLMTEGLVEELISHHKDREYLSREYKNKLGLLTDLDIMEAYASRFDGQILDDINKLIMSLPVSIVSVYEKEFLGKKVVGYPPHYQLVPGVFLEFRHVEATLMYLLAQALPTAKAVEKFSITDSELTDTMLHMSIQLAKYLHASLETIKRELKDNKVFVKVDKLVTPNRYVMAPDVSKGLLDKFGLDTVVGLALLEKRTNQKVIYDMEGDDYRLLNGIEVRAKDTYATAVKNQEMQTKQTRRSQQVLQTIAAFEEAFNAGDVIDLPEGADKSAVLEAIRREAAAHMDCDPEKITDGIRRVVTNGIYPDSGAAEFLAALDSFGDTVQSPREGATLAAIELYAKWGVNQIG